MLGSSVSALRSCVVRSSAATLTSIRHVSFGHRRFTPLHMSRRSITTRPSASSSCNPMKAQSILKQNVQSPYAYHQTGATTSIQRHYTSHIPRPQLRTFPVFRYKLFVYRLIRENRERAYTIIGKDYKGPVLRAVMAPRPGNKSKVIASPHQAKMMLRDTGNTFPRTLWTPWLHYNVSKTPLPDTVNMKFAEYCLRGKRFNPFALIFYLMLFQTISFYFESSRIEILQDSLLSTILDPISDRKIKTSSYTERMLDKIVARAYAKHYPETPKQLQTLKATYMRSYLNLTTTPLSSFYRANISPALYAFHENIITGNVRFLGNDIGPIVKKYYPTKPTENSPVPYSIVAPADYQHLMTKINQQTSHSYMDCLLHEAIELILLRSLYEAAYIDTLHKGQIQTPTLMHGLSPEETQQQQQLISQIQPFSHGHHHIMPQPIHHPELAAIRKNKNMSFTPETAIQLVQEYTHATPLRGVHHVTLDVKDAIEKGISHPLFSVRGVNTMLNHPSLLGSDFTNTQLLDIPDFYKPFYPHSNEYASPELAQFVFHCDRALSQLCFEIRRVTNDMNAQSAANGELFQSTIVVGDPSYSTAITGIAPSPTTSPLFNHHIPQQPQMLYQQQQQQHQQQPPQMTGFTPSQPLPLPLPHQQQPQYQQQQQFHHGTGTLPQYHGGNGVYPQPGIQSLTAPGQAMAAQGQAYDPYAPTYPHLYQNTDAAAHYPSNGMNAYPPQSSMSQGQVSPQQQQQFYGQPQYQQQQYHQQQQPPQSSQQGHQDGPSSAPNGDTFSFGSSSKPAGK